MKFTAKVLNQYCFIPSKYKEFQNAKIYSKDVKNNFKMLEKTIYLVITVLNGAQI